MLTAFAALVAASQAAPPPNSLDLGRTAWIVATVGHSEWCPAGNVRLDLISGRYAFTPRAARRVCNDSGLERPVNLGRLDTQRLAAVRAAYLRVWGEGLESSACQEGRRPESIIISNGGTPILVLATGGMTVSAPDDLSCWTEAAWALQDELDEAFSSAHQR